MLLIGITGPARAGKDTAAQAIKEELSGLGLTVRVETLAAPIWRMVQALMGDDTFDPNSDDKGKPHPALGGLTPRDWAIAVGQGCRAQLHPRVWLDQALACADVKPPHLPPDVLIISDVRAANEIAEIKARGGYLLGIKRADTADRVLATEWEGQCDRVILNNGPLLGLQVTMKEWARDYYHNSEDQIRDRIKHGSSAWHAREDAKRLLQLLDAERARTQALQAQLNAQPHVVYLPTEAQGPEEELRTVAEGLRQLADLVAGALADADVDFACGNAENGDHKVTAAQKLLQVQAGMLRLLTKPTVREAGYTIAAGPATTAHKAQG